MCGETAKKKKNTEQLCFTGSSDSCAKATDCAMQPAVATGRGNSVECSLLLYQHAHEQKEI
jgi:hypothetical protein